MIAERLQKLKLPEAFKQVQTQLGQIIDRFTNTSLLGVDIGSAMIKVVEIVRSKDQLWLRQAIARPIENGDLIQCLKHLMAEGGFQTSSAALGLASPQVIVHSFKYPQMPRKELISALGLEAERAILNGHVPDEMAKDWHQFGSVTTDTVRGLLAVVPKKIVSNKVQSAKAAGLIPMVVDVEALALWNAYWLLVGNERSKSETILLANVGAQTTNLIIAKEPDELILVRDIESGKESTESGEQSHLVSEIHDSLVYARSKFGLRTLDRVYVTGGAGFPEIVSSLKSLLRVPIALWNPFDHIKRDPFCAALDHSQGPLFAVAIGLALRRPS